MHFWFWGALRSRRAVAKYDAFADHVIQNKNQNLRQELDNKGVGVQAGHEHENGAFFQKQREYASGIKGESLFENAEFGVCFVGKHPNAIGNVGKEHGKDPSDYVGDQCIPRNEYRKKRKNDKIDCRGQGTEKNVKQGLFIFSIQRIGKAKSLARHDAVKNILIFHKTSFNDNGWFHYNTGGQVSGAFYNNILSATGAHPAKESTEPVFLAFDASRSNSIYGNSNTVQPSALVINFCIKY